MLPLDVGLGPRLCGNSCQGFKVWLVLCYIGQFEVEAAVAAQMRAVECCHTAFRAQNTAYYAAIALINGPMPMMLIIRLIL